MVKQIEKVIDVDLIDNNMFNKIKAEHESIRATLKSDSFGILICKLNNTKGDIDMALRIAQDLHSDPEIIPITEASGVLDVSGTVLTALGCHGRRTASPGTQFILNETGCYLDESKAEDLERMDAEIYNALIKMGASKPNMLEKIKSGEKFSAEAAKKMGIIDDINGINLIFGPVKKSPGRKKINKLDSEGSISNTDMNINKKLIAHISDPEENKISNESPSKIPLKGKTANTAQTLKGKKTN